MRIIRWAAVAVTALFALMNLGAAVDSDQADWIRIGGAVLAVAGVLAASSLALARSWGRAAVIGVGALNVIAGAVALVADEQGGVIGVVGGGLGVVLGFLSNASEPAERPHAMSGHR